MSLSAALPGTADAAAAPAPQFVLTRGWATFGIALPQGSAPSAVQVGTLPTQTDVKVRWPDGSIRFAVVSANIPRPGTYAIAPAAAPAGSVGTRLPQASVTLTIAGRPYTAALVAPPAGGADRWLDGPLVTELRRVVAPGMHPFLRVIFDVRLYADGASRVDVAVENCLDEPGADAVTYDVDITVGNQPVFHRARVAHKYLARWRQVFGAGSLVESDVAPDLTPFAAARALPPYRPGVAAPQRALSGGGVSGTGFDILQFGDFTIPMNAHSGRPEIAPYPDWTAQYLVHKRADQRAYVLRHGELAGSWGIHVRNGDGSFPTLDDEGKAYYWLDPRWHDNAGDGFTGPRGHLENRAEQGDIAHQPSLGFVPYLVTGDRFFADETAFWANYCLIGSFASDDNRKGAQGLLVGNEVRGIGWALRNIGDAAAYLPDASPMKAYLAAKVWNNLTALDRYAASVESGPVQTLFHHRRPEDTMERYQPYLWISLWEQTYLAWAVDRVMQHGRVASVNFADAGATVRNRIARLQLQLFTNSEWPKQPDRQAPYLLAAGRQGGPQGQPAYFRTFSEVAAATFAVPTAAEPDFPRPFEGYYGPEARLLLMICDRLGDRGAAASLAALMAHETNGVSMSDDLNRRSGWAIDVIK